MEEVVKRIEDVASSKSQGRSRPGIKRMETEDVIVVSTGEGGEGDVDMDGRIGEEKQAEERWIDAVVISHEFTDHMHAPTLLSLPPSVPVFATSKAFSAIKSWKHFDTVRQIDRFTGDWRQGGTSEGVLPEWIGVHRVAYAGSDLLYYHSAILISFSSSTSSSEAEAEGILYTPHGISPSDLTPLSTADPKISILALLHGLQDISLQSWVKKAQLNMGAHNGLKVVRLLGVKYWVGTHDEVKKGGGVVGWFLRRVGVSLQQALEEEGKGGGEDGVRFVEVGNGESLILE